jgi:uncharacterized protein
MGHSHSTDKQSIKGFSLSKEDETYLLSVAREAIESKVERRNAEYDVEPAHLREPYGVFVSLHVGNKSRGCIGSMTGIRPLTEAVREMAQSSALHDPRFAAVECSELSQLNIEISVLSPLKKIDKVEQVEVGNHGIYIVKGSFSGVLLPQVAVQENWNRHEFLTHTCNKAGLPGNAWQTSTVEIFIFSAIIFAEE